MIGTQGSFTLFFTLHAVLGVDRVVRARVVGRGRDG